MNVEPDAQEWGWKIVDGRMVPLQTGLDVAPNYFSLSDVNAKLGVALNTAAGKK
jgi:hypothetical protein